MDKEKFCNKVITIPQYNGTCWLNTILMCILYSQYSRKLLLNNNPFKGETDKLSIVLNEILLKHYMKHNQAAEYYATMKPETILSIIIPNVNDVNILKTKGWVYFRFIPYFLDFIKKSYIIVEHYNNKLYTGIYSLCGNDLEKMIGLKTKMKCKAFNFVENPEYICVNIWDKLVTSYESNIKEYGNKRKYQLNTYTTDYKGLYELQDEITFNGNLYRLDSCILNNYNQPIIKKSHSIAGITCKNNKYIYNGWLRKTIDGAIATKITMQKINELLPCELMKYNWDIHNDSSICLLASNCGLLIDKNLNNVSKDLCFSFNKGYKTVFYVKVDLNDVSINKNINNIKYHVYLEIKKNNILIKKLMKDNETIKLLLK